MQRETKKSVWNNPGWLGVGCMMSACYESSPKGRPFSSGADRHGGWRKPGAMNVVAERQYNELT